ncbi:MAG: two-component sensor histidine kinase [Nocardioidaceae bacterium]|nr:two-component sensor histidine kinase [Nocardioidaceae bacterium]
MGAVGRIAVAVRALALVVLIPYTLLQAPDKAATPLLVVIALAALLNVASLTGRVREDLLAVLEGAVVAGVGVAMEPAGSAVFPYLIVPAFLGGLAARVTGLVRVVLVEGIVAAALWIPFNGRPSLADGRPVAIGLGAALLAAFVGAALHRRPGQEIGDASYRDAIGLIQQLDALSGKLTSGLDPVTLAEELMSEAEVQLPVEQAAVFTRDKNGTIAPLRYSTFSAPTTFGGLDDFVENCWRSDRPLLRVTTAGLPLRSGSRPVGVMVLELTRAVDQRTLLKFQHSLAGGALQLQAALLFDNVRAHATSEERNRLAREVHDGVAQDVASLGYMVDALAATASGPQQEQVVALRTAVTKVVAELRASVYDLRNEMRAGHGLGQGVSAFARQIGSRSDLTVHVRLDEGATRLRPDIEAELLRIAQEAMNNARKHSGGHNLWVSCTVRPPYAEIEVVDDGAGLGRPRHDSHGLRIMRERAETIGAQLDVESLTGPESGTRLRVRLGGDDKTRDKTRDARV